MALTAKQDMFVKEYLVSLNATQAAIKAGYSEKTAKSIGQENLTKPDIQKFIDKALKERSKRIEWTTDEILRDLKEIALDRDIEPQHRIKAYELGGKYNGMFKDKLEHSGTITLSLEDQLRELIDP